MVYRIVYSLRLYDSFAILGSGNDLYPASIQGIIPTFDLLITHVSYYVTKYRESVQGCT